MGKKSKMSNSDPILKKNFKYQKRKKQRELQKQRLKQQQQQQDQKLRELRMIEKKVQQTIEQKYQEERRLLLEKKINKPIEKDRNLLSKLFRQGGSGSKNKFDLFMGKAGNRENGKAALEYENQIKKKLDHFYIPNNSQQTNWYTDHFQISDFPPIVKSALTKHKKTTSIMKIQQQIKQEIKSMFSIKKVGDNQQLDSVAEIKRRQFMKDQEEQNIIDPELKKALQEEQKEQQPFELDREVKLERQVIIDDRIYAVNKLVQQRKNVILKPATNNSMKSQNQNSNQQMQTAAKIVNSYTDMIFVQNKEEQTIEDFRKIVINHMYNHQLSCLKALTEGKKSKGFTNAKFLIITPYVGDAKAIFDIIQQTFMKEDQSNIEAEPLNKNISKKQKRQQNLTWMIQNKQKIEQNQEDQQNDFFRVGIKILPKKKKISYFANFDSSDIIVASPIGLKSIINGDSSRKQTSFLSSVEILYLDRASVIMMQNWDHLVDIFANLNYMPKYESLKNSINQIRPEYLQLKARIFKQNIVFTEFAFPELNSLKINHFHNYHGCVTSRPIFSPLALEQNANIEKNYFKIQLNQPRDDLQVRFDYFKRKFWDKLHNSDYMKKIVLFVNSYFQFVKLKAFLQKVNASFQSICQHTKKQKIQSRISRFNNGQYRILLLTQRAYYFGLCQIKKHRHIYFYSLPKNPFIYKDMIESMNGYSENESDDQNKIVCIYSKYDKFIIERIVGSAKAIQMVKEYCTSVSFIL